MSTATATATVPAPTRTRKRRGPAGGRAGAPYALFAWVVGLLFFMPVAWMVLTSLHSETSAATNPPSLGAPLTLRATASSSARAAEPARSRR